MPANLIFFRKVKALDVRCVSGACWITWQGGGDRVLLPGERIAVRGARLLCVEALRGGEVRVEEPQGKKRAASAFLAPPPSAFHG